MWQPRVWQEVLLAAIGDQFSGVVEEGDRVVGVSMSIRERDDILQIWNNDSSLADQASPQLTGKVTRLFTDPPVQFLAVFYKRELPGVVFCNAGNRRI